MFDKKLIISLVSTVLLYVILLKTNCDNQESTYYDRNSMLYAAVVGVFVFLSLRSFADPSSATPAAPGTVGENVMTTPFQ